VPLESPMSQDVLPPAPADGRNIEGHWGVGERAIMHPPHTGNKSQDASHSLLGLLITLRAFVLKGLWGACDCSPSNITKMT
jgi:hypothetical protein